MDRLELRATARAVARASRTPLDQTDTSQRRRERPQAPPLPQAAIDEESARRACAPMGQLDSIVTSKGADKQARTFYLVVPDPAMSAEYERLGFELQPGCKVLVDAAALRPLAVVTITQLGPAHALPPESSPSGFNPYFDVPAGA